MQLNWHTIFPRVENEFYYLACSGGVDSMVLCYLMHQAKLPFEILHVNFHLRDKASDRDEALVVEYAKQLDIKVHIQHFDTLKIHQEEGGNLENICRDLRYSWFDTFLTENPHSKLVVGHHLDDQIETFYLQLARKAGIVGLSSMNVVNGRTLRPLLDFSKQAIYAFAQNHHIPWREDHSNAENDFTRNKLRNVFIPFLEENIPTLKDSILTVINAFQTTKTTLINELQSENLLSDHFELDTLLYQSWNVDKKHIFLHLLNIRSSTFDELEKLIHSDIGKYIEIDDWFISKKKDSLAFDKIEAAILPALRLENVSELPASFSRDVVYLDASKINGDLQLRKWQEGDKLAAIGVNGSKLVSKIINEAHLSAYEKRKVLVLTDAETILWIVGIKVGRHAVAKADAGEILKISVQDPTM